MIVSNWMDSTTELASQFTVGRYQELHDLLAQNDPAAWNEVLGAVRRRVSERFLRPMRDLARFDKQEELPNRPGFAILALDCLLIDTIQAFREGRVSTCEVSPAHSFKTFLHSPRFSDFRSRDRSDFFHYVRNGILHNGETRKDWKVRIDTLRMLERTATSRTINRRLFHAGVIREWRDLYHNLQQSDAAARAGFLRRMDSMAGLPIDAYAHVYFAYGSNLLTSECERTMKDAQAYGMAYLPGYRLVFTKHSTTRNGDAASITPDPHSMVWGFLYRLTDEDEAKLTAREGGYHEQSVTVQLIEADGDTTPVEAFTYIANAACPKECGPPDAYLDLIIRGARERNLPQEYQDFLASHQAPKDAQR
jgi:cation transport regulator ChaC